MFQLLVNTSFIRYAVEGISFHDIGFQSNYDILLYSTILSVYIQRQGLCCTIMI